MVGRKWHFKWYADNGIQLKQNENKIIAFLLYCGSSSRTCCFCDNIRVVLMMINRRLEHNKTKIKVNPNMYFKKREIYQNKTKR